MLTWPNIGGKIPGSARDKCRWSWLVTLLKVGLSALAFGVVAFSVDLTAAWQHAANQSISFVGLSALILTLQLLLGGLRWHAILARLGANPSLRELVRLYYISAFFNAYLWGAVGGRHAASMADLSPSAQRQNRDQLGRPRIASQHWLALQF